MINIGIIGLGDSFKKIHYPALLKIKEVRVISLFDIDELKLKIYLKKYKIKNSPSSEKYFFSNQNLDAVIITSPNFNHYRHIMMALKNGKHVICEKPLVLTTHEMQEVKKLASKKNLICTCFLMQRYRKPSIILKKNIRNNFFGSIYHADINIILSIERLFKFRFDPKDIYGFKNIEDLVNSIFYKINEK